MNAWEMKSCIWDQDTYCDPYKYKMTTSLSINIILGYKTHNFMCMKLNFKLCLNLKVLFGSGWLKCANSLLDLVWRKYVSLLSCHMSGLQPWCSCYQEWFPCQPPVCCLCFQLLSRIWFRQQDGLHLQQVRLWSYLCVEYGNHGGATLRYFNDRGGGGGGSDRGSYFEPKIPKLRICLPKKIPH